MKTFPILLLALVSLTPALVSAETKDKSPDTFSDKTKATVEWNTDYPTAVTQARRAKILMMMLETNSADRNCVSLNKAIFANPTFEAYAKEHLALLKIDYAPVYIRYESGQIDLNQARWDYKTLREKARLPQALATEENAWSTITLVEGRGKVLATIKIKGVKSTKELIALLDDYVSAEKNKGTK